MAEQHDTANRPDVPDAAETVSTKGKERMSDDLVNHYRAEMEKNKEQAIKRKLENQRILAEMEALKKQIETLTQERDEAIKGVEEIKAAYEQFTDENELQKEIDQLRGEMRVRDLHEAFNSVDGIEYQDGVSLDDILKAAAVDMAEIEEITPEFVSNAIEAARASKPFLFVSPGGAGNGEVRQEESQKPGLKAFGGQATGGGAAPPAAGADPAKTVDWRNPEAINAHIAAERRY